MVWLKKLCCLKKLCVVGFGTKVESAVGFSGKPFFLESVSFHLESFDLTNFRLVLVICNVHAMIFIKKISG